MAGCEIYLISPPVIDAGFAETLAGVLDTGEVAAFQLRLKGIDQHGAATAGDALRRLCADHEVAFIVNDDMGLAKRLGADGVHLGQSDGDPADARRLLGPGAQIGVTCHDSRHLAMAAGEAGADYVAFGAFFPSMTKDPPAMASPMILHWWQSLFELPCVAIGGITPANAPPLVRAGADFLAVSGAVWNAEAGPVAAVHALREAIRAGQALDPLPPRAWADWLQAEAADDEDDGGDAGGGARSVDGRHLVEEDGDAE